MTETERLMILRWDMIAKARMELPVLKERKRTAQQALDDLERYYPEWWTILYYKYVRRQREKEVMQLAARGGIALTPQEYRTSRRDALHQFDKWAVGLI